MNRKITKLSSEQLSTLAEIGKLVRDLTAISTAASLARKFGTSKQLIEYYIQKAEKGESK